VPLTCTFLALLSHPSHQMARADSISLVISLVAGPQESPAMPGSDGAWQCCRWGSDLRRSGQDRRRGGEAALRRRLESEGRLATRSFTICDTITALGAANAATRAAMCTASRWIS
jgi:hypothetical protein